MMCNEQAYSLAVEKLLNIQPPPRAQWIRGVPQPLLPVAHCEDRIEPAPRLRSTEPRTVLSAWIPGSCIHLFLSSPFYSAIWRNHSTFEPHHGCDHTCPGHWGYDPFLLDV